MGRTLLGLWTWFAFTVISGVGFCICLVLFLVTAPFDPTRRLTGTAIRQVGRLMCGAVPAWSFRAILPLPIERPARTVCVSNHVSNIDPFALLALPWEMKFMAKSVLFQIPFVGWGIRIAGDIPLVRGSSQSVKRAMSKARFYVERGMPVLFFPEGTRSTDGSLLPFKDGAFRIAIECQAEVLPMALVGTRQALKKGDWRPAPARALIKVGEPIPTVGMTLSDLAVLRERTRDRVRELVQDVTAQLEVGVASNLLPIPTTSSDRPD